MLINEDRLQTALTRLAETDEDHAKAKAHMKATEERKKTVKASLFLDTEGRGAIAQREALVESHPEYQQWVEDYENAVYSYELLNNQRLREQLVIEVWRSLNSSRNRGNI